ncbi:MAG: DUF1156 domain-containing protein [Armatimonadetes bacterium]|nr:DUF1156 domain-containing protein [Armatimonadota bacterium]
MTARLIETDFPLRDVSEESVREKNIRHGHISTLHIWWARKPLAASRAMALAALLPDDPNRREEFLRLVREISPWETVNGSPEGESLVQKARDLILQSFGGVPPRVLDPFAGGGSIPLEALRLGCETHAMDVNPVAVLLNKCVLEYPQKFGNPIRPTSPGDAENSNLLFEGPTDNPLLDAVRRWGEWVLEEARRDLEPFYPADPDGSVPVGYYWMRTIPCQNPSCGAEITLTANWWLAKKEGKRVALRVVPDRARRLVDFEIVGQDGGRHPQGLCRGHPHEGGDIDFDPEEGTVARAHARCPVCGGVTDDKTVRSLFREGKSGQRMVAVVLHHPVPLEKSRGSGKSYRLATKRDMETFRAAEGALEAKRERLRTEWGMDPVPDEPLPLGGRDKFDTCRLPLYGYLNWGDLFNARQKLSLITFAEKVRFAHARMIAEGCEPEFAKAVATYLALDYDKLATYTCSITRWRPDVISFERIFDRQAIPMVWDYGEVNPFSESRGSWDIDSLIEVLQYLYNIPISRTTSRVHHGSATEPPFPDDHFDAILTDPPYYDNVAYSDLSDFFYVWLKRTVGDLHPELFATPLTPKSREMVADPCRQG